MSRSIKTKQPKEKRNMVVRQMILATKSSRFSDKRNRRGKMDKEWKSEEMS